MVQGPTPTPTPTPRRSAGSARLWEDLIYETFYSAAIGGSAIALFFLVVDSIAGRPLFTPSLMGSVLFLGMPAHAVTEIRLDMVARFSIVHFAAFAVVGLCVTLLVHWAERHARHPLLVFAVLFALFELGTMGVAAVLLQGVMGRLGPLLVALANLSAALSMGLFFLYARQPERWARLQRGVHLG